MIAGKTLCKLGLFTGQNPRWLSGKESTCQSRRRSSHRFDPWVGKISWRRKWQPTPAFLTCKTPWTEEPGGVAESDTTEHTPSRETLLS